jgi:hypothetical protein
MIRAERMLKPLKSRVMLVIENMINFTVESLMNGG